MSIGHLHPPGVFDAGHCRACARQAGLLDHYQHVQDEEARLVRTVAYARAARRYALWALGSSGVGVLLAVLALLTR
jgi:alpha-beta hydrolase superfamily lysophospholipase